MDNKIEYNFKPDLVFKYLFKTLSNELRIKLINSIFHINLEYDTEISVSNTESVVSDMLKNELHDMRSDTILDAKHKRRIHLEFQSTTDDKIGIRIFLYGISDALSGKKGNILVFPLSHILYTVLYGKDKYGEETVKLDIPECVINGRRYNDCRIDIIFKYTNLLKFSLEDFSKNNMESLSFIYLYRYIKNQKQCSTEKDIKRIIQESNIIVNLLDTITYNDKEKLAVALMNLLEDIRNIVSKSNISKGVVNTLETQKETYAEKYLREAKEKASLEGRAEGRAEAKTEIIKKLSSKGMSINEISSLTDLSITEVTKLLSYN